MHSRYTVTAACVCLRRVSKGQMREHVYTRADTGAGETAECLSLFWCPHGSSQPSATLVPGELPRLLTSVGTVHTWCTDINAGRVLMHIK